MRILIVSVLSQEVVRAHHVNPQWEGPTCDEELTLNLREFEG